MGHLLNILLLSRSGQHKLAWPNWQEKWWSTKTQHAGSASITTRRFNFHLKEAGSEIRVKNFGRDLKVFSFFLPSHEVFFCSPARARFLDVFPRLLAHREHISRPSSTRIFLQNSEAYSILLKQLSPEKCNKDAMKETDLMDRAEVLLPRQSSSGCAFPGSFSFQWVSSFFPRTDQWNLGQALFSGAWFLGQLAVYK